ncbi:MAG: DUF805 domain-containing protein [Micrococcales bacterium]|nr:DUF805 domain-containing protein [Micrococcales bacterium]
MTLPLYSASAGVAFRRLFKGFFQFRGRASQSEYWWAVMWMVIISFSVDAVGFALLAGGVAVASENPGVGLALPIVGYAVMLLFSLTMTIAMLALGYRRLQDANMTGALTFLSLAIGIWAYVIGFFPTKPEGQRFDTAPGLS